MQKIKFTIRPEKNKENYVAASRKYSRNKTSFKINKDPLLITQLQIDLGVRMFQKDAQHFVDLIKENKGKEAEIQIVFKS